MNIELLTRLMANSSKKIEEALDSNVTNRILIREECAKIQELYEEHKTREKRNEIWFSELFMLINFMGNDRDIVKLFKKELYKEHRTLIQNFFRMIADIIENYAKEGRADARNEGSLEWAKKVAKIDWSMPHI